MQKYMTISSQCIIYQEQYVAADSVDCNSITLKAKATTKA